MAESSNTAAMLLKSFVFHFQKLGLDLKCPICLEWLNKPILLPCNHIFCKSCATKSSQPTTQCPMCEQQFTAKEIKPSSYLDNIVTTYKCLDSAFNSTVLPLLSANSGTTTLVTTAINQMGEKRNKTTPNDTSPDSLPSRFTIDIDSIIRGTKYDTVEKSVGGTVTDAMNEKDTSQIRKFKKKKKLNTGSSEKGTECDIVKKSVGGTATDAMNKKDTSQIRKLKKEKKLNSGSLEKGLHSDQSEDKCKFKEGTSVISSTVQLNESVCAFCQSSEITERTGPLLHYAGGKEVARDDKDFPNAVIVHRVCSLWSPKIYFTDGVIKNLKSELVRASKLKCQRCGLKGAALGCFFKSCPKSYHVPCAVETTGCRWEDVGYLMLCPDHRYKKFPSENSNPRQNGSMEECSLPTQSASKWSNKEWVICGSSLSSEEKLVLDKFATICGATVFDIWNPKVTHVITATDSNGAYKRTMEVLMGILNGRWILNTDWIKACQEAKCPVNEGPYEVGLDDHGCRDGPKTGRLRALNNAPKLFDGLIFYFNGEFVSKSDLLDLVRAGGGAIVESLEQMHNLPANSKTLVVYNRDFPQGCAATEAAGVVLNRLADAEDFATGNRDAWAIPHTWILESVAAYNIVSYDLIS